MATAFQVNAFQNNAFQIVITPTPSGQTGGDGWTKEEWKHYKDLEKKRHKVEEKRNTAFKTEQELRKQTIRDLVDPESKARRIDKNKVKSNQQVSEDTPSEVTNYDALIANLERQKQDLFDAVLIRQAKQRLEQELAVLEAKRQAELDDEQALLLLL
jgi:hypothetical protein